jgi:hypothetical protein
MPQRRRTSPAWDGTVVMHGCPLVIPRASLRSVFTDIVFNAAQTCRVSSSTVGKNTALIGEHWDDDNGARSGSAYLFDVTSGTQIAKLTPADGQRDDQFGWSVALSGDIALIGAPGDDDKGEGSGAAYLVTPAPVPLPAGVWLLASGLGLLAFRGKRA